MLKEKFEKEDERLANAKENLASDSLSKAYELIHDQRPDKLEDWEIAGRIVEVLDEPSQIPADLAKECVYLITNSVNYPDDKTRINIVLMAEEKASKIFSELSHIDEVHMADIERAYYNWKKSK